MTMRHFLRDTRAGATAVAAAAVTEIFVIAAMHSDHVRGPLARTLRACSSKSGDPNETYVFLNHSIPENFEARARSLNLMQYHGVTALTVLTKATSIHVVQETGISH